LDWTSCFTSNVQNPVGVTAPTAAGNYLYTLTATSGAISCSASTNLIVVPTPPIPTVVTPVTYCLGSTAQPLTATVTTVGNTLVWYTVPVGGVGSATAPLPSTAALGSTTYYVSQKAGLCEGPRTPIVVTIVVNTTPLPVVITPVAYCQNAVATTLVSNATAIAGASLLWHTVPSGGTGTTVPPTPSTALAGSTTYYVSQLIGTCESLRVPIVVVVTALSPVPTVTTPVNYCVGSTSVALTAVGTNLLWYTASTGGAGSATAPIPNTSTASTITYFVTQTNASGCASPRVPILVNVFSNPSIPTIVTPVVYCQGVIPVALTAVGTNLTWHTVPIGGPAGSATAPTPSTGSVGNTIYYVQANNGTCFSPRAAITVTVNATPLAPSVISPVIYCQGVTPIPLFATGTNLTWYTVPPTTGSPIAPTPNTTNIGNTFYEVSSTLGTCEGPKASILVAVNPTPVAPTVVTPVTYCQSATAVPLTAIGIGIKWYNVPSGGVGSTTAPTPSTGSGGSTTYYVSSTQGNCEGPRAAITVIVTATPAPPSVTTPVVYCQGATSIALTATGTSIIYYSSPTGGVGSTTAPIPSTANVGSTNYYVTQSTSGVVCESPRALIVVTVNAKPLAPTVVSPVPYCQTVNAIPLTASVATGNTLLWYTTPTGVPGSTSAPIPSTSSVGSTTYYVSQTTALACEGPRSPITVNVTPVLTVFAGNDTIMARGNTIQLNGQSTGVPNATYLWTANISPLALSSATILNPFANPIATTIYTLRATDPSGLCPSVTDNVKIEVVQSCVNVRNAFTPNGDGINDKWFVYDQNFCLSNPGGAKVNVFNRYGSKVFESQNYTNSWDGTYKGKPVPDGTYYAVIEFTLFDGTKQLVKTDVTVIR
jgi:large repetitive protein